MNNDKRCPNKIRWSLYGGRARAGWDAGRQKPVDRNWGGMGGRESVICGDCPSQGEKAGTKYTTPKCLLLFKFSVINPSRWWECITSAYYFIIWQSVFRPEVSIYGHGWFSLPLAEGEPEAQSENGTSWNCLGRRGSGEGGPVAKGTSTEIPTLPPSCVI